MPKSFNIDNIGLSSGYEGHSGYDNLILLTNDNTMIIKNNLHLSPYEGITIRIELPEGYFINERMPIKWKPWFYIFTVLLTIAVIILWFIYGKDKKIFPTVEFYPSKDLSPAEIGYIVDGTVDNKDFISLIIYWAEKGYIKLVQKKKHEMIIVKLCELPDNVEYYEQRMFNDLFKTKININDLKLRQFDLYEIEQKVSDFQKNTMEIYGTSTKDLKNKFYTTIDVVL